MRKEVICHAVSKTLDFIIMVHRVVPGPFPCSMWRTVKPGQRLWRFKQIVSLTLDSECISSLRPLLFPPTRLPPSSR